MQGKLYWEDFIPGDTMEMGSHTFTEAEIVAFARQFDPQPFHLDPAAAANSFFKGLVASGWHTCAIAMRLMVDGYLARSASLGSPGLDNLRWLAPVRAGDTISYRRIITAARPSASRPGVGLVHSRWEALNQRGDTVMTMEGWNMFGRRPA
ncbi:MAG: MaoC family dehydratase [Betaproteobacteria bacterium]|nr:MaoC family dehydratase [Betaproteobacteria bacterium]MBM3384008.1 MaoC family dehydratase [Betaproteobacteria bacterium]